jgi:trimethylamine--corrinoid protein Co-methyltransferase
VSPLDMRTGIYACGRPEKEICNVAMVQMARRYGASYRGHTGHSDAKRPSVEAGFQRALNSIPTLMACGHTTISCGQLSVDEVFSPLQLIIDDEMVSALKRFMRGFEVNEETLALEVIREVGPGGNFLATDHTASHFRSELWEPRVFEREMLSGWERSGAKTDTDKALDIFREIIQRDPPPVHVSEATERTLLQMIQKASGAPISPVEPH